MSNESFDNKIRSKFEDFEPIFQEQDWQNFAPILHPKTPFWHRLQKPFAYAAVAATIVFLVNQNNQLSIENKKLHSDNQILKIEKQAVANTTNIVRDTIYINAESKSLSQATIPNLLSEDSPARASSDDNKKRETGQNNKKIIEEKSVLETKLALQQENKIKDQASVLNEKIDNKAIQNSDSQEIKNNNKTGIDNKEETATITKNEIENVAINQPLTLLSTLDVPKEVHSKELFFVTQPVREWFFEQSKIITPKVAKHRFAVGLNTMKQGHANAIGIIASYQIFKHFEINTGISFHSNEVGMFKDDNDFRDRNKGEFRDKFHQPLPPNTQFTNIRSEIKSIQIPVNVSYIKNIYRNLSYIVSVGAVLNINKTQHYDYLFSENGATPQPGKLPLINENKQLLGEAIIGTGLQYQWRNFVIRAEPIMAFNLQEMERRGREKNNLGFRTQLYYRF